MALVCYDNTLTHYVHCCCDITSITEGLSSTDFQKCVPAGYHRLSPVECFFCKFQVGNRLQRLPKIAICLPSDFVYLKRNELFFRGVSSSACKSKKIRRF